LLHVSGRIAAVREEYERAEEMLGEAFRKTPTLPHHGAAYAEVLAILGRYVEALAVIEQASAVFQDDAWLKGLRHEVIARMPQASEP
jgi:tetratricopeptide (TPR) repeat protein